MPCPRLPPPTRRGRELRGDRVFDGTGCVKAQGVADVSAVKAKGGDAFDGSKGFQKAGGTLKQVARTVSASPSTARIL